MVVAGAAVLGVFPSSPTAGDEYLDPPPIDVQDPGGPFGWETGECWTIGSYGVWDPSLGRWCIYTWIMCSNGAMYGFWSC